jgi:hypothetical protein
MTHPLRSHPPKKVQRRLKPYPKNRMNLLPKQKLSQKSRLLRTPFLRKHQLKRLSKSPHRSPLQRRLSLRMNRRMSLSRNQPLRSQPPSNRLLRKQLLRMRRRNSLLKSLHLRNRQWKKRRQQKSLLSKKDQPLNPLLKSLQPPNQ